MARLLNELNLPPHLHSLWARLLEARSEREGLIIGFMALGRMQRELTALLERPVDLVPKDGLKPVIRQDVLAGTEVIYAG